MSQGEFKLYVVAGMTFSSVRDHVGVTTNDGSRSAGEGLCVLLSFLFHDTNKIKWKAFSYIFYLVISSDSINEKVLMISVHH